MSQETAERVERKTNPPFRLEMKTRLPPSGLANIVSDRVSSLPAAAPASFRTKLSKSESLRLLHSSWMRANRPESSGCRPYASFQPIRPLSKRASKVSLAFFRLLRNCPSDRPSPMESKNTS